MVKERHDFLPFMQSRVFLLIFISGAALFLGSCAGFSSSVYPDSGRGFEQPDMGGGTTGTGMLQSDKPQLGERRVENGFIRGSEIQDRIVASGIRLTESHRLEIQGRSFPEDCTGVVLAAYWGAGLDPVKYFDRYSGNGVKRLHDMGAEYDLNYLDELPNPGDVIIWDDTYDKDGNGRWGDPFTHAGVVISVEETGQIVYVHYNYSKGVVLEKMNLKNPDSYTDEDGTMLNSPMRLRADRHIRPDSWLSSHLIRNFIPLYLYPGLSE